MKGFFPKRLQNTIKLFLLLLTSAKAIQTEPYSKDHHKDNIIWKKNWNLHSNTKGKSSYFKFLTFIYQSVIIVFFFV